MGFGELLKEGLRRVELEGERRLVDGYGRGLLAHLLALQVPLQSIEEEAVVGYAVPVEHFLLFLSANAVVLVKKVKERALGLLQRGVGSGLEVAKIRENTLFELLGVLDWPAKGLETE